jgi:5'-deoxynucleotidase YfbR-like HD superfamily hydrolase
LNTTNTEHNSEIKKQLEERKLQRMAMVHDMLEMWQGSQNLSATKGECHAQYKQMTAIGYISDMEQLVNASWSLLQHDWVAAFTLSE